MTDSQQVEWKWHKFVHRLRARSNDPIELYAVDWILDDENGWEFSHNVTPHEAACLQACNGVDKLRPEMLAELLSLVRSIAKASPMPDDWEFYDAFNDPWHYQEQFKDGTVAEQGVDISNQGDVRDFGIAQGRWEVAQMARAFLTKLEAPAVRQPWEMTREEILGGIEKAGFEYRD